MSTMSNCAGETADVVLAAGELDMDSLNYMIQFFNGARNKPETFNTPQRDVFSAVTFLLTKVRQIKHEQERRDRREARKRQIVTDVRFAQIVADF